MNSVTKKKVTIMLDADVYESVKAKVGARKIGEYISRVVKPYTVQTSVAAGYNAMAADGVREQEAKEWVEDTGEVPIEANDWTFAPKKV